MGKHGKPAQRIPGWTPQASPKLLELHYEPNQIAIAFNIHKNTVLRNIQRWFPNAVKLDPKTIRIPASDVNRFREQTLIKQEAS